MGEGGRAGLAESNMVGIIDIQSDELKNINTKTRKPINMIKALN